MKYNYLGYQVRKIANIYEIVKIGSFRTIGYVGSVKTALDYIDSIKEVALCRSL